jgi:ABC-type dipeptide/oligopeptide/nickel transport system permease component
MLGYLVHRILIMIPTLIAISLLISSSSHRPAIILTYRRIQSQGEQANLAKIAFLKAQYGLTSAVAAIPLLGRRLIRAIWGTFSTTCRSTRWS